MPTDERDSANRPVAAAIQHARTTRGDTQRDLAAKIGVRLMTVSDWERAVVRAGDHALWQVACAYDTSADALLREYIFSTMTEKEAFAMWQAVRDR